MTWFSMSQNSWSFIQVANLFSLTTSAEMSANSSMVATVLRTILVQNQHKDTSTLTLPGWLSMIWSSPCTTRSFQFKVSGVKLSRMKPRLWALLRAFSSWSLQTWSHHLALQDTTPALKCWQSISCCVACKTPRCSDTTPPAMQWTLPCSPSTWELCSMLSTTMDSHQKTSTRPLSWTTQPPSRLCSPSRTTDGRRVSLTKCIRAVNKVMSLMWKVQWAKDLCQASLVLISHLRLAQELCVSWTWWPIWSGKFSRLKTKMKMTSLHWKSKRALLKMIKKKRDSSSTHLHRSRTQANLVESSFTCMFPLLAEERQLLWSFLKSLKNFARRLRAITSNYLSDFLMRGRIPRDGMLSSSTRSLINSRFQRFRDFGSVALQSWMRPLTAQLVP